MMLSALMSRRSVVYPLSAVQSHDRRAGARSKLIYILCSLVLSVGCHKPSAMTQAPSLAVLTNLEGVTEPCGCTSRPLGGIDRIAQALLAASQKGPLAFAAVGSTFFTEAAPTVAMLRHEQDKARAIAEILSKLAPKSIVTGPLDNGPMAESIRQWPKALREQLHLVQPSELADTTATKQDSEFVVSHIKLGAVAAALIAAPTAPGQSVMAQAQYAQALVAQAQSARAKGAAFVVVLWPHGLQAARTSLDAITDIDIVLTGSTSVLVGDAQAGQVPELLGQATLLQGGARGERLGFLTLHPPPEGHQGKPCVWPFFDGHKAERARLGQRAERLRQEAKQLPEGAGQNARLNKAQALEAQASALPVEPPKTAYVTWHLEDIDQSHKPEAWASQALAAFNRGLCDSAKADTASRVCPAPKTAAEAYVGTETCRACHAQAFEVYAHTAHARAWATLTQAGKQCDLTCVPCHVVGFERPGGFCHLADAEAWANVGCESCHGPGAGHIANPSKRALWGPNFVRDTPEATCRGCHNQEHSDTFNFAGYRPQIIGPGHGAPAP